MQYLAFLDEQFHVDDIADRLTSGSKVPPALQDLHTVARLCNGAKFEDAEGAHLKPVEERVIKGDATDTAIFRFAETLPGFDCKALTQSYDQLFEIPFNSRNKWMLSLVRERKSNDQADLSILVKGAPDVLFPACSHVLSPDGSSSVIDSSTRARIHQLQAKWSSEGQRVLALCRRSLSKEPVKIDVSLMNPNDLEEVMYSEMKDLTLVGLVGIRDPPRSDVKDAVAIIRRAGVRVFMVTGDFKLTALAIAQQVWRYYNSQLHETEIFLFLGWHRDSREGRHSQRHAYQPRQSTLCHRCPTQHETYRRRPNSCHCTHRR